MFKIFLKDAFLKQKKKIILKQAFGWIFKSQKKHI